MNFICSITHTLIKKSDPVRIFFLESHKDPVFPFMNYNQATSTGHFMPMGCAFKAKFADNAHNEYFTFSLDGKDSPLVKGLLDYVNKKLLSKEDAEKDELLSHNSRDLIWGKIDTLEELFHRCRDQSVYFEKDHKGETPFVTVMVMHESAYQLMLKHGDIENAVARYQKAAQSEDFMKKKQFEKKFLKARREEIEACRGKTHNAMKEETVIVDEAIFEECLERIKHFKESDNPKMRAAYDKSVEELREEIGTEKTMNLFRDRFVDEAYIDWYMEDTLKDIIRMGDYENQALKEAGYSANTHNFVASKQTDCIRLSKQWKKENWLPILEAYLLEFFMTHNGYEFLPSRRQYPYRGIANKAFFKEMTELKVYK